jgi:hypothetical protein
MQIAQVKLSIIFFYLSALLVFSCPLNLKAQTALIAGSDDENTIRDLQLLNKFNKQYSFNVRNIFISLFNQSELDSIGPFVSQYGSLNKKVSKKNIKIISYPLEWGQQLNTHSAWGRNNGVFLASKGYQQKIVTGGIISTKWIEFQFLPELHIASQVSSTQKINNLLSTGQSALRLHLGPLPFSISLSSENIWWGPGVFNSLMMSNNAPGFNHVRLHTNRPWKTPIGVFEFQVVSGYLKSRSNFPFENINLNTFESIYGRSPSNEQRLFSGLNLAYSPVFFKTLSIGLNRMFQLYERDIPTSGSFIDKYAPVLASAFFKNKTEGGTGLLEDAKNRDQLINIFARLRFPSLHAEIYGEYGWNDYKYNLRDLTLNPDHASAYLLGLRKVFPLSTYRRMTVEAELTQMAPTNSDLARPAGNWYVHWQVNEGYTHYNQIIGGGLGPGDNTATLRVSRINKLNKQVVTIERYQHNPRFHTLKWTDWSFGLAHQQMLVNKLLLSGRLELVHRNGYQWTIDKPLNVFMALKAQYFW